MFLKSLHIQHYRSLASVEINGLRPLTLLTGRNAAGKSNVIDVLKFLRDIAAHGLDYAMSERGGITIVRQYSARKPFKISIKAIMAQTLESGDEREATYDVTIGSLSQGNYQIEYEMISWWDQDHVFDEETNDWVPTTADRYEISRYVDGEISTPRHPEPHQQYKLSPDVSALGVRWPLQNTPTVIQRFFAGFSFSTIYPNTLRNPTRPDTSRALKESGENWASILKSLRKSGKGKQSIDRIMEMMQVVLPSLQEVNVKSAGGYLVPKFLLKEGANTSAHEFDPVQLSDGTLRIFGILLSLYQNPPPPLLALEEPEQTIHPAMLALLSEAFRETSQQTQIFITSHSPHFVDYFDPEEIRVVSMKDGKTQVSPIHPAQIETVKDNLMSLQELMVAEGLLPEEV